MSYETVGLIHDPVVTLCPTPEQAKAVLAVDTFDTWEVDAYIAMRVGDEIGAGEQVQAVRCDWQAGEDRGTFIFRKFDTDLPADPEDNIEQARLKLKGMAANEDWAYDALGRP